MIKALQKNWRIYLIEAWALGMFMVSAALFTILLEHPALPLRSLIASAFWRRFFIGLAMGLTAIFLIYSTWGKRSGAHMNPAVTLAFLQLDRIRPADAAWYILAQFAGGTIAVLLFKWLAFDLIAAPEVNFAVTVPGQSGIWPALGLEMLLSFLLLGMVLVLSNHRTLAPYTGYFVGGLLVVYICVCFCSKYVDGLVVVFCGAGSGDEPVCIFIPALVSLATPWQLPEHGWSYVRRKTRQRYLRSTRAEALIASTIVKRKIS